MAHIMHRMGRRCSLQPTSANCSVLRMLIISLLPYTHERIVKAVLQGQISLYLLFLHGLVFNFLDFFTFAPLKITLHLSISLITFLCRKGEE